jgi:hypothetical protein
MQTKLGNNCPSYKPSLILLSRYHNYFGRSGVVRRPRTRLYGVAAFEPHFQYQFFKNFALSYSQSRLCKVLVSGHRFRGKNARISSQAEQSSDTQDEAEDEEPGD